MRALVLIATLALASCASGPGYKQPQLVDSSLWPGQHQLAPEVVCEGSEDVPACSAEVRAERLAAGRNPEGASPR